MKLRSPESFWLLKNGILNSYPSLKEDITCDYLVVGSGITGALISHALMQEKYDVAMVDKRDVATGSSSATTSMLQYEIDTPMHELAEMIGETAAVECYRAGIDAINALNSLVNKEKIACGFELKNSLQVAHSRRAVKNLEKEFELRKKHGFKVEWLTSKEISKRFNMKSYPGILAEEGASVDAFQLAHGLIMKNNQRGMRVFDQTEIKKTSYNEDNVEVVTDKGHKITCKKIIYCTGFETLSMFKKKYADIVTTFASVCEQNFNFYPVLKDTLIWDTDNPYIYMRTTDDERLLIGGEDIKYKYDGLTEKIRDKKSKALQKKLQKLFPKMEFIEDYNWAGAFGVTKDGLPFIGEHPDFKNAIFVMGLGGNGITFSTQGMDLVIKILNHQDDILLHYYRFDR